MDMSSNAHRCRDRHSVIATGVAAVIVSVFVLARVRVQALALVIVIARWRERHAWLHSCQSWRALAAVVMRTPIWIRIRLGIAIVIALPPVIVIVGTSSRKLVRKGNRNDQSKRIVVATAVGQVLALVVAIMAVVGIVVATSIQFANVPVVAVILSVIVIALAMAVVSVILNVTVTVTVRARACVRVRARVVNEKAGVGVGARVRARVRSRVRVVLSGSRRSISRGLGHSRRSSRCQY